MPIPYQTCFIMLNDFVMLIPIESGSIYQFFLCDQHDNRFNTDDQ